MCTGAAEIAVQMTKLNYKTHFTTAANIEHKSVISGIGLVARQIPSDPRLTLISRPNKNLKSFDFLHRRTSPKTAILTKWYTKIATCSSVRTKASYNYLREITDQFRLFQAELC